MDGRRDRDQEVSVVHEEINHEGETTGNPN